MRFTIERFSGRRSQVSQLGAVAGFTLVELLVVISIIALLISILLPSLKKAREQAKVAVCTSNMKGIASASVTYATADAGEQAVPVHPVVGTIEGAAGEVEFGGKSGQGEPLGGNNPVDSKWGTRNGRGPATRPLNDVLFKGGFTDYSRLRGPGSQNWINDYEMDVPIYKCPSDIGYSGHHYTAWKNSELSSYDHYGNSYSANASWIGVPGGNCVLYSNSSFLKPLSRVPNPANTVYFLENAGRFGYRVNYGNENDGGCSSLSGPLGSDVDSVIKGWHGRPFWFVTAFVDGHASMVKMNGHQQPEPPLEFYPGFGSGGGETSHQFWHCVIFRGPGWQRDTLPAPPVKTDISCARGGVPVNGIE